MSLIKYFSILILVFFISGCEQPKETENGKYFKTIINNYFGKYYPDEYVSIDKPESKYSIGKIWKARLSLEDYKNIDRKLKEDGWTLISDKDNFYEYCLGEQIYLGVLFPIKAKYYNLAGNEILQTSQKNWSIFLSYSSWKVNYCNKNLISIG